MKEVPLDDRLNPASVEIIRGIIDAPTQERPRVIVDAMENICTKLCVTTGKEDPLELGRMIELAEVLMRMKSLSWLNQQRWQERVRPDVFLIQSNTLLPKSSHRLPVRRIWNSKG